MVSINSGAEVRFYLESIELMEQVDCKIRQFGRLLEARQGGE